MPLDPHVAALLLSALLGVALGFSGGLFGIGGGIIAIPLLAHGFGMDQKLAQGTALVTMVPNLVIALGRYVQREPLPARPAASLALLSMLATALAAHYATGLESASLRLCFGVFLLGLALYTAWRIAHPLRAARGIRWPLSRLPLVGLAGGACSGLIGVGGGIVATPIFVTFFGLRQTVAQGYALALVTPSCIVALATYGFAGLVDWSMGLALAAGGFFAVTPGVRLAHRLPERALRLAFAGMLGVTALGLIAGR